MSCIPYSSHFKSLATSTSRDAVEEVLRQLVDNIADLATSPPLTSPLTSPSTLPINIHGIQGNDERVRLEVTKNLNSTITSNWSYNDTVTVRKLSSQCVSTTTLNIYMPTLTLLAIKTVKVKDSKGQKELLFELRKLFSFNTKILYKSEDEYLKEGQIVKAETAAPRINAERGATTEFTHFGDISSESVTPRASYAFQKAPERPVYLKRAPEEVLTQSTNNRSESDNHSLDSAGTGCSLHYSNFRYFIFSRLVPFPSIPYVKAVMLWITSILMLTLLVRTVNHSIFFPHIYDMYINAFITSFELAILMSLAYTIRIMYYLLAAVLAISSSPVSSFLSSLSSSSSSSSFQGAEMANTTIATSGKLRRVSSNNNNIDSNSSNDPYTQSMFMGIPFSISQHLPANPYLVCFHDAFISSDNYVSIVMEYMNLGSFEDLMGNANVHFDVENLAVAAFSILMALNLLNDNNIGHGNIRPSSIFVNSSGEIKIANFGIIREFETSYFSHDHELELKFSSFMCKERINSRPYNFNSDIYSLGLTLLYIVSGCKYPTDRYPFVPDVNVLFETDSFAIEQSVKNCPQFVAFLKECMNTDMAMRPNAKELLLHDFFKKYLSKDIDGVFKRPLLNLELPQTWETVPENVDLLCKKIIGWKVNSLRSEVFDLLLKSSDSQSRIDIILGELDFESTQLNWMKHQLTVASKHLTSSDSDQIKFTSIYHEYKNLAAYFILLLIDFACENQPSNLQKESDSKARLSGAFVKHTVLGVLENFETFSRRKLSGKNSSKLYGKILKDLNLEKPNSNYYCYLPHSTGSSNSYDSGSGGSSGSGNSSSNGGEVAEGEHNEGRNNYSRKEKESKLEETSAYKYLNFPGVDIPESSTPKFKCKGVIVEPLNIWRKNKDSVLFMEDVKNNFFHKSPSLDTLVSSAGQKLADSKAFGHLFQFDNQSLAKSADRKADRKNNTLESNPNPNPLLCDLDGPYLDKYVINSETIKTKEEEEEEEKEEVLVDEAPLDVADTIVDILSSKQRADGLDAADGLYIDSDVEGSNFLTVSTNDNNDNSNHDNNSSSGSGNEIVSPSLVKQNYNA